MGWSIGFDTNWDRDIGYGVPAYCDHPECSETIDRGLSYVCGGEPYGGEKGCGLFFCEKHKRWADVDIDDNAPQLCDFCLGNVEEFPPKPEHPDWMEFKLKDESWQQWRVENPHVCAEYIMALALVRANG